MFRTKVIKFLSILMSIGVCLLIFFNPITNGQGDMSKIAVISNILDEFMNFLGFLTKVKPQETVLVVAFLEFFVFGLSLMTTVKVICEDTIKHIFFPLFTGLFSSVLLGYSGYRIDGMISGINSVMIMFWGLILGIGIFLTLDLMFSGHKNNKMNRRSKYRRGR